jgi:hypothetical protein
MVANHDGGLRCPTPGCSFYVSSGALKEIDLAEEKNTSAEVVQRLQKEGSQAWLDG